MPDEIVRWIGEIRPRTIVDGTYGGGGHTGLLLDVLADADRSDGSALDPPLIIGMDRDPAVIARDDVPGGPGSDRRIELFLGSYEKSPAALAHCGRDRADAFLLDLGLSSDQLADRQRGFSFTMDEAELDLRFDPESDIPAQDRKSVV